MQPFVDVRLQLQTQIHTCAEKHTCCILPDVIRKQYGPAWVMQRSAETHRPNACGTHAGLRCLPQTPWPCACGRRSIMMHHITNARSMQQTIGPTQHWQPGETLSSSTLQERKHFRTSSRAWDCTGCRRRPFRESNARGPARGAATECHSLVTGPNWNSPSKRRQTT